MTRKRFFSIPLLLGLLLIAMLAVVGGAGAAGGTTLFDSIPTPYPGAFSSLGYQANSTDEFGDHVQLIADGKKLDNVVIGLTNWACENDFTWNDPNWTPSRAGTDACVTTSGASFEHPITLKVYAVDDSGPDPAVGALITSKTETFDIPFRPSYDATNCNSSSGKPGAKSPADDVPFGGTWYDPAANRCYHGYAFNLTFDFSADNVVLPEEVIVTVAYNTGTYGETPIGATGPYDSLNVSLTELAPTIGTDVEEDFAFWDTSLSGYSDVLARDFGWTPWTLVMQINAPEECTTTCYADVVNGSDANGGTSLADAKKTIQAAVNAVSAGGQVIVAPGTYPENVIIPKSLTLTGDGDGTNPAADTILDGTDLSGKGIFINPDITDVTIEELRVQDYIGAGSTGIWGDGSNSNFVAQNLTVHNNGNGSVAGGGMRLSAINGIDNVLITGNTFSNNNGRGFVIWDGYKSNITITNNTVTGNNCCGIELQDGTASGVTVTGNTVTNQGDSGMAFTGLMGGDGPNLIANNTLTNNGRFGIEIKLPNGTGLATGDGSIVVEDNVVSRTVAASNDRDYAGIAVFRRGILPNNSYGNANIPTGVIVRDNTVSGYQQPNTSDGFGIVVEGTNMHVTGNTLTNNDVGVQVQAGHTPYTGLGNITPDSDNGNQANLADLYFGRGNSPVGCAAISGNTFTGNTVNTRNVNAGGGIVTNVDTSETFCSIQAAVSDSDTVNDHTIEVPAGVYAENVIVNKSLTINGANAGISPNDPTNPLNANPARVAESEVTVTGGNRAFSIGAADVTIDGFKFTNTGAAAGDVQSPIIGAGGGYGGDAPGLKVLNNLFDATSRTVVYFNGSTIMQGGTVDDNRVANPARPTPCAVNQCGHQLFNLWKTNNLSFQRNVTFAPQAGQDRIRTLNISDSTNVTLADNTVRYTCNFTCFTIAADASGDVTVTGNDLVTDEGNVLQIHSTWTTTGATINVHHNILTTGADFPIAIDDLNADLDNVSFNRNAISGTYHVRNGNDSLTTPGAETVDATCNWWGSASGPTPANFFGPSDYTPWLFSNDLDGDCYTPGTITVVKETTPDGDTTEFEFDPSWGANFTLADGESEVSPALNPNDGPFSVAEINLPMFWTLDNAECTNGVTTADPSSIPLADGESWTCTFENSFNPPPPMLIYISPNVRNGVVDGVVYNDQDILVNIMGTSDWEMFFDGSTFGITKNLTDFTFDGAGCLLMTFNGNQKLGGITYTPQDVAKFCPTVPNNYTAGTFSMYFDGSDVGLSGSAEIIDALELLPDGRLVVSTKGNAKVPGTNVINLKAQKNDMLVFDYITYGPSTTGTWDLYFNNTDVAGMVTENIISSYINGTDTYMTFWTNFTVGDETGDFNDIVVIHDDNTVDVFWDANDWGYTGRIHGLHMFLNP